MLDWLHTAFAEPITVSWETLLARLALALVLGTVVAGIHRATRRTSHVNGTFPATLVMLCVLIAMVTQVIGDNVARAFSLVGALSIVRFRTVVQDTKDTAFVIFAVVVGMAVGAGQYSVALCGIGAVGTSAVLFRDRKSGPRETDLHVRLAWPPEAEGRLTDTLARYTSRIEPISAGTARKGTALELTYYVQLLPETSLTQLVAEVSRIEGVQSIELRGQRDEG